MQGFDRYNKILYVYHLGTCQPSGAFNQSINQLHDFDFDRSAQGKTTDIYLPCNIIIISVMHQKPPVSKSEVVLCILQ